MCIGQGIKRGILCIKEMNIANFSIYGLHYIDDGQAKYNIYQNVAAKYKQIIV